MNMLTENDMTPESDWPPSITADEIEMPELASRRRPAKRTPKSKKVKKIRVSRLGRKTGKQVPIEFGQWIRGMKVLGRAPNDRKHPCVFTFCSLCGGTGKCRYGELRHGIVKSCRCLELAADAAFQAGIDDSIYHLETRRRKRIFADIVQLRTTEAMEKHGLTRRYCNTLFYRERDRLAKMPQKTLTAICRMAESNSIPTVARKFLMTRGEILHIVRSAHRAEKADQAAIQERWDAMDEPTRIAHQRNLHQATSQIDKALKNAAIERWIEDSSGQEVWNEASKGRYEGELTQAEFCSSSKRYSYFRWIYIIACMMPEGVALTLFGDRIARFIHVVDHTMANRARRYEAFRTSKEPKRKGRKVQIAKRNDGYYSPGKNYNATAAGLILIGKSPAIRKSIDISKRRADEAELEAKEVVIRLELLTMNEMNASPQHSGYALAG